MPKYTNKMIQEKNYFDVGEHFPSSAEHRHPSEHRATVLQNSSLGNADLNKPPTTTSEDWGWGQRLPRNHTAGLYQLRPGLQTVMKQGTIYCTLQKLFPPRSTKHSTELHLFWGKQDTETGARVQRSPPWFLRSPGPSIAGTTQAQAEFRGGKKTFLNLTA